MIYKSMCSFINGESEIVSFAVLSDHILSKVECLLFTCCLPEK